MEIIKNVKSVNASSIISSDYFLSGSFVQRRVVAEHEKELLEVVSSKEFATKKLLFIDHPFLYQSDFSDVEFLLELIERVPNLVLSCNELGLLFELKNKIREYEKRLYIAHKRLRKGVDYYMYPKMFQNDNMVNDIINRANKKIKIMVNSANFPHGPNSKLSEIETRLNAQARVLIYTNNPYLVKKDLK